MHVFVHINHFNTVVRTLNFGNIKAHKSSRFKLLLFFSYPDNVITFILIDNNIKLVSAGLQSKAEAIMEIFKCDEETALKKIKRIAKEQNVGGAELDDILGKAE